MLVGMDRYRVYLRPGVPAEAADAAELEATVARGSRGRTEALAATGRRGRHRPRTGPGLACRPGRRCQDEFVVRFQQTCGPAMAKAIEDTAYYRYVRLVGLNEVGGDPTRVGVSAADFHAFAQGPARAVTRDDDDALDPRHEAGRGRARPTLRAVRAPRGVGDLGAHRPRRWPAPVRADELDVLTEYFLWQTVVGAWPISEERLQGYALKAIRESKLYTRWTEPDEAYEAAVERFVSGVVTSPEIVCARRGVGRGDATGDARRGARAEARAADDARHPGRLPGHRPRRPLPRRPRQPPARRLRRAHAAGWHDSTRAPPRPTCTTRSCSSRPPPCAPDVSGPSASSGPTPATSRSTRRACTPWPSGVARRATIAVVTVVTRLAGRLHDAGGFGDATVTLPDGSWTDVLSQRTLDGGPVPLASLIGASDGLPVALLVRVEDDAVSAVVRVWAPGARAGCRRLVARHGRRRCRRRAVGRPHPVTDDGRGRWVVERHPARPGRRCPDRLRVQPRRRRPATRPAQRVAATRGARAEPHLRPGGTPLG